MLTPLQLQSIFDEGINAAVANIASGQEGLVLSQLCANEKAGKGIVHICANAQELAGIEESLSFFAPWLEIVHLPAWDCLPYDRVSPSTQTIASRIEALNRIASIKPDDQSVLVLTTANALLQKLVPSSVLVSQQFSMALGNIVDMDKLVERLVGEGFDRTSTVRERGEFAVRGGILDLFVPGEDEPIRLDFFGDTLESIRSFDAVSQLTTGQLKTFSLQPMSEISLDEAAIKRFRKNYIEQFGAATRDDALYQAISEGRCFAGMEHWLPLFYEELDTLFDYTDGYQFTYAHDVIEAVKSREEQINDHYQSRQQAIETKIDGGTPYKPVVPLSIYLSALEIEQRLTVLSGVSLSPYDQPPTSTTQVLDAKGKAGRSFAVERTAGQNVFDAVAEHVSSVLGDGRKVLIAAWSQGSKDRFSQVLMEHGSADLVSIETFEAFNSSKSKLPHIAVLPLEEGFETPEFVVIAEQDVLGDRLVRRTSNRKRDKDFIAEASSLSEGDIVVHVDHGIARFVGLRTIEAAGAPHDCLELRYAGDDKLFLPVENIELLSRYGNADSEVLLDKLGGVAWQSRKAKLKKRLLEMADQLIKIAAERALKTATKLVAPDGLYGEFAARFPYDQTEDQMRAIDSVFDDLSAGTPMDRLVCGDVGFGKTEVALRAAFVAVMGGKQAAIVVPTTLLARQHFKTFTDRFKGLPVNIRHASRLVGNKELSDIKKGLADGSVDIVVGTHALLGNTIVDAI